MRSRRLLGALAAAGLLAPASARAFQIKDPIHHNCHELLASGALAEVGYLPYAPPSDQLSHDERAFLDDGDYEYVYDRNMHMAALVTGVRFNDLSGSGDFHFNTLAPVHNAPDGQEEHCLRAHSDTGDDGNIHAVQACRDYIAKEVHAAMAARRPDGSFDPEKKEDVKVHVQFRGTINFPLSTFWFHAGRALHATQDGFTHTFRDPTWHQINHVDNWVDQVRGDLVEAVNGHGHEKELDDCTSQRPSRPDQVNAAERASVELLTILTTPADDATRETLLNQFLDRWFTYQPGCNVNNAYCSNAVYQQLRDRWSADYPTKADPGGCASAGEAGSLAALGLVLLALRRRRAGVLALALACVALPGTARADAAAPMPPPEGPITLNHDPPGLRFVAHLGLSFDNPAFAYGAGVLWQFERWEVGVEAEHNPWLAIDRPKLTLGALNIYARGGYRKQLSANFSYRAGINLGVSTLLVDTVGSSPGQVGPFLGLEPLSVIYHPEGGLEYELSAFNLQVPELQLRGWPYGFPQYRITFGMRFH